MSSRGNTLWYIIAVIGVIISAPNSMMIRLIVDDISPVWANVIRFVVIAAILMPWVIRYWKQFTSRSLQYTLLAGVSYGVASVSYVTAIMLSQASYVATIDLAIPILLMIYSVILTNEKVSMRSFTGITIAALGAFAIIALPALSGANDMNFGLVPTLLALLNCIVFPLTVIFSKKAADEGVSIWAIFGVMAIIVVVCNALAAALFHVSPPPITVIVAADNLFLLLYTAIGVALLARVASVEAYKHIGSATVSVLVYIESFAAILLPILILGEVFTREMAIGGLLILLGVLIIETHFHPRLHIHRKHLPRHH